MDAEVIRREVEDAGRQHYAAACAGDTAELDRLLAAELVYSHSDGSTDDKVAYLDRVIAGNYRTMTVEHSVEYLIPLSDELAVVRGKQISNTTGETGVKMENVEASSLDVWVNRDGRWQLVGHHMTLVLTGDAWRRAFEAGR
jgi:ketosteroid isomerase-like protein